jgi:predicted transcriptional regulator YdeE
MILTPTFITRSAFTVAGYQSRITHHTQIHALWQRFIPYADVLAPIRTEPDTSYGMMRHFDPETRQFDYLAGVAVNHPVTLDVECDVWHIPTQEYATFPCTLGTLVSTYELIYTQWVRVSPYYVCDGVRFEYYDVHFMGQPDSRMSLYLPIRKTSNHIDATPQSPLQ